MEKNKFESSRTIILMCTELIESTSAKAPAIFDLGDQVIFEKGISTVNIVCSFLIAQDFDIYPNDLIQNIHTGLGGMKDYFDNLRNNVLANSLNERFNWFIDGYNSFFRYINPVIPFSSIDGVLISDVKDAKTQIEAMFSSSVETKNQSVALKGELETLKGEIDTLVTAARTTAQDVIVTRFGVIYEDLSDRHRKNANLWLGFGTAFVAGLIALSFFTLNDGISFMKGNETMLRYGATMIIWIGARLIFFTALSIGIGICISNYRANRHNQILNKHRQNALSTFETFVKSSGEDPIVKNAILMEVTRTIFSPQSTGFSSSDNDSESQSKVVEIVKNISGSKD